MIQSETTLLKLALHPRIFFFANFTFGVSAFQDRKRRFRLTRLGVMVPGASAKTDQRISGASITCMYTMCTPPRACWR